MSASLHCRSGDRDHELRLRVVRVDSIRFDPHRTQNLSSYLDFFLPVFLRAFGASIIVTTLPYFSQ